MASFNCSEGGSTELGFDLIKNRLNARRLGEVDLDAHPVCARGTSTTPGCYSYLIPLRSELLCYAVADIGAGSKE